MRYKYMTIGRDVWRVDADMPEKHYETVLPSGLSGGRRRSFIIGLEAEKVASFVCTEDALEYVSQKNMTTASNEAPRNG